MVLPSNEYARVTHVFEGTGLVYPAVVTYAISIDASSASQTMIDNLATAFNDNLPENLCNTVGTVQHLLKEGPDEDGPTFVSGTAVVGSIATAQAPANLAFLIHKITGSGGRRGRGRMYLPGVAEAAVGGDGDLDNTVVTNLQADATAWLTALIAVPNVVNMVIEHEPGLSSLPSPTTVTGLVADGHAATQRRRMRR